MTSRKPPVLLIVVAICAVILPNSVAVTAAPIAATLSVSTVTPNSGNSLYATPITISGQGFIATPRVTVNHVALTDVVFVNSNTLRATIPPNFPAGPLTLRVTNPDGTATELPNAFTVLVYDDLTIGDWEIVSNLPYAFQDYQIVTTNDHVYLFGNVYMEGRKAIRAAINPDGSLGPWQDTNPLPVYGAAPAALRNYMYAIGETGSCLTESPVLRAPILPDGSLGNWEYVNTMGQRVFGYQTLVLGDILYAIAGAQLDRCPEGDPTMCDGDCFMHPVGNAGKFSLLRPNNTLSEWQPLAGFYPWDSTFEIRPIAGFAAAGATIYQAGAPSNWYCGGVSCARIVKRSTMAANGQLSALQEVTNRLNEERAEKPAVLSIGGHVFVLGGYSRVNGVLRSVEQARITPSGDLSQWRYAPDLMREPRRYFSAIRIGNYVYAIGGVGQYDTFSGLRTIERARIVTDTTHLDYGVTINEGALFTNNINVKLTISARFGTRQMQVSNDGGFAGAKWEPYALHKDWQITQYGDYVIPRVVYVRFKDRDGNVTSAFQDDIILDVTPPTGSVKAQLTAAAAVAEPNVPSVGSRELASATAWRIAQSGSYSVYLPLIARCAPRQPEGPPNVTLRLSATDDVSGVDRMIISNSPDFACAEWENYTTARNWYVPEGRTTIYVKFRDKAGNVSSVATDTVTR